MRIRPSMVFLFFLAFVVVPVARGDLIVTLIPQDANGNPLTNSVAVGSRINVEVFLSAAGNDNPLTDVQFLQLDFAATDSTIEVRSFQWLLDPMTYGLISNDLPTPFATSASFTSQPDLIALNAEPLSVAMVTITVNDDGTLNAVGSTTPAQTTTARFDAGIPFPRVFSLLAGNLQGGRVSFVVTDAMPSAGSDSPDGPGSDSNNDGASDTQMSPPVMSSDNSADQGNTSGDQMESNTSSPRPTAGLCGVAMPATMLLLCLAMSAMRRGDWNVHRSVSDDT